MAYIEVDFLGRHYRNIHNKNDTYTGRGNKLGYKALYCGSATKKQLLFQKFRNAQSGAFDIYKCLQSIWQSKTGFQRT
jgi:hypothetical protein